MPMDRRLVLRWAPSGLLVPSLLGPSLWSALKAAKVQFPAALLVPRTGEHAALGRSMERAALLALDTQNARQFHVFDTLGTADGAIGAAKLALHGGARILLGPVLAAELPGVIGIAGSRVPVLSFSNDARLKESGAFVFGITAAQIVAALLRYVASRGVRRVGVLPGGAGNLPDAVLIPDNDQLAREGASLTRQAVQVLGAVAGLDFSPDALRSLEGAWFAAPDPATFASFSRAYEERIGSPPGLIAGLAYDAARIVQQLRMSGGVDRSALLAATGFKGVCGDVRFREDGSAARALTILAVRNGNLVDVAPPL